MRIPLFPRIHLSGIHIAGIALMVAAGSALHGQSAPSIGDGFDPNANGIVNNTIIQPDGKILIGGYFTQIHPDSHPVSSNGYVARLNHDGSVDQSFSPQANNTVYAMVLQPNGQILVGGAFTTLAGTAGSTSNPPVRNYAGRLNADGTLDTVFNPNANGAVYAIAYQPNGQIIIGGSFTTVQPTGSPVTTRNHIARFNADGSLDTTFDPNTDKPVLALAVQSNGQIVVGGGFSSFTPNGASSSSARSCVARLNSDGSLDPVYDPEPNGSVTTIVLLPDGRIVLGGQFTGFQPGGQISPTQIDFLARFTPTGAIDETFVVDPLGSVSAIAVQSDGKLVIGGTFTEIDGENSTSTTTSNYTARINPDGSIDDTFNPNPDQAVNAIAIQQDGAIVLGGYFQSFKPFGVTASIQRHAIARVLANGAIDATLAPDNAGTVFSTLALPNGQFMIGGSFVSVSGVTRSYLARLNADGSLDTTFTPTLDGSVQTMVLQANGQVLIGGLFENVDGVPRTFIARINADGSLDGPFNPNPNGEVTALALQANGQILVGGLFSLLTPNGAGVATSVTGMCRLNTDGTLDTTFNPSPQGGGVYAIMLQPDGRIVVAGEFTAISGVLRSYIARLLSSGAVDTAPFDPEANLPVYALLQQSDGKIIAGGAFTALLPQTGKIGTNTTTNGPYGTVTLPGAGDSASVPIDVNHLVRLNTDGTIDTTFYPDPSAIVLSLALQSDGSVIAGGTFTSFAQNGAPTGTTRNYVGRVTSAGALDTGFNPNANGQVDSLTLLSTGKILIAGTFTALQPNGAASPVPALHVAVVNSDGSLSTAFSAGANGTAHGQVNSLSLQADGSLLLGGSFAPFGGATGSYFSRFNSDGSPDTTYNPDFDGPVNTIAVEPTAASNTVATDYALWLEANGAIRHTYTAASSGQVNAVVQTPDGKVLVGGLFSNFAGNETLSNLVRIMANGAVDTSYAPAPNAQVTCIVAQPDGKVIIGGDFTQIGSVAITYLARLNTDGSVDSTFDPSPNAEVTCLALQSNGQVIAGGSFTGVEDDAVDPVGRNSIARFNSDGSIDENFNPDLDAGPNAIAVLPNGQILIVGDFTQIDPNGNSTIINDRGIARLNSDGTVDTSYYPDPNGQVLSLALQSDGKALVGGTFTAFQQNATGNATTSNFLARLNTDGSLDTTFNPNPNGEVFAISILPSGQVIIGGAFTQFKTNNTGLPISRNFVARINADGSVDTSFDPQLDAGVGSIAQLSDGSLFFGGAFTSIETGASLLVGGSFANVGGTPAPHLVRLNNDGTVDSTFTSSPDGPVNAITFESGGLALVGGTFANVGGQPRANLAQLNADGTLNATFNPGANAAVNAFAVQANGQILVGGAFTSLGGIPATYLGRLGLTGSADPSFLPAINGPVYSVVTDANGQIVIGGSFTSVDGVAVGDIARLNSDGSIDATFNPQANGTVEALTLQVDGTIVAAGSFTTIGGQAIPYAARIEPSGAVDTTFTPAPNAPVNALLVQTDGKVVLGGGFTSASGFARYEITRVPTAVAVGQSVGISTDLTTLTWTRSGGAPAFSSVVFEESLDGVSWTTVGQGMPVNDSTWQLSGVASLGSDTFYVRATGVTPESRFSSSGLDQVIQEIYPGSAPVVDSLPQTIGSSGSPFSFAVTATKAVQNFAASGLPPGLSINAATGIISGMPTGAGTYNVLVTVSSPSGSSVSSLVIMISAGGSTSLSSSTAPGVRLLNLSSRDKLSGSQTLIAGFVISGSSPKAVLLRAVGPGLSAFGLTGLMATPELDLFSSSGTLMMKNTGWGGTAALSSVFSQVGAFALPPTSADASIETSLAPGSYTLHVFDASGAGGVVLTEIYDASASPLSDADRLVNISARGSVSSGSGALIGGFEVSGSSNKTVLIRGIGPGLAQFGVTGTLSDPILSVFDSNGNLVAKNTGWGTQTAAGPDQGSATAADVAAANTSAGAFALSVGSADTALIATLPPGTYTFQVTSASNATGEALGEVYELP